MCLNTLTELSYNSISYYTLLQFITGLSKQQKQMLMFCIESRSLITDMLYTYFSFMNNVSCSVLLFCRQAAGMWVSRLVCAFSFVSSSPVTSYITRLLPSSAVRNSTTASVRAQEPADGSLWESFCFMNVFYKCVDSFVLYIECCVDVMFLLDCLKLFFILFRTNFQACYTFLLLMNYKLI